MEQLNTKAKRTVMIGTPCMYGSVDVWYTNSLIHTIKMGLERDIEIIPIWLSFDALIQRVRNDTLQLALEMEVDDLVWIDSDIEWDPKDFFKLLDYPVDIVGGTYRKKGDIEEYVFRPFPNTTVDPVTKLLEVQGLGTGFVRMSKNACQYLFDASPKYIDQKDNKEKSMAFNLVIETINSTPTLVSEDLHAFDTLRAGGFKIWLDKLITCNHIGTYKFKGDYARFNAKANASNAQPVRHIPKINRQL